MSNTTTLDTVPQEVLEQIAYYAATDTFLGPPSSLIPLLLSNRHINASLSIATNHHLYAEIFAFKFDTKAPLARFGTEQLTSCAFANELKLRCVVLKRLRCRLDSTTRARSAYNDGHSMTVHDVLSTAYILMLENGGKNKIQLSEYGLMKVWIKEFWFDPYGASLAIYHIRLGKWPLSCPETSLAMWLFWFFLNVDDYLNKDTSLEAPISVLKVMALGAHKYNLTATSWVDFEPKAVSGPRKCATAYSESLRLVTPPLATPAILSFLALDRKRRSIPLPPSDSPIAQKHFQEWDSEWGRSLTALPERTLNECFMPGSVEGVWEGFFTYSEFTAYAALLAGASPNIIREGAVGEHQQTWKLREHHLLTTDLSGSDSGIEMDIDQVRPLRAGDPLRSYFPARTQIREHRDGLLVQESGGSRVLRYQRPSSLNTHKGDGESRVLDIIFTGEGHSAWGQFNLVGRVRPCDGFISLSKHYVDGERGKWLYRGYLVGNAYGNLAGRWRDTLSPADVPGYEGCFVMTRRR